MLTIIFWVIVIILAVIFTILSIITGGLLSWLLVDLFCLVMSVCLITGAFRRKRNKKNSQ